MHQRDIVLWRTCTVNMFANVNFPIIPLWMVNGMWREKSTALGTCLHFIHKQLFNIYCMSGICLAGVSNLLASLRHTGRRRVFLGQTLNIQTLMKTDEQKKKGFK